MSLDRLLSGKPGTHETHVFVVQAGHNIGCHLVRVHHQEQWAL
ncbi:hypothetical protein [Candidatus Methylacidithermus pantelleriae]|nr:hypothetical protein [Candidatus Methylacidithermus pantelleriae]